MGAEYLYEYDNGKWKEYEVNGYKLYPIKSHLHPKSKKLVMV
jgi:hypothetical protein